MAQEISNKSNNPFEHLNIDSEDSLLETDVFGNKLYKPCCKEMETALTLLTDQVEGELHSFYEHIKLMSINADLKINLFYSLQNIATHLRAYLQSIENYSKAVYISFYPSGHYTIVEHYNNQLRSISENLTRINLGPIYIWAESCLDGAFVKQIYDQLKTITDEQDCTSDNPCTSYENFCRRLLKNDIVVNYDEIIDLLQRIDERIKLLSQIRFCRSKKECTIIYKYLKKEYDQKKLKAVLDKFARQRNGYFESKSLNPDSNALRELHSSIIEEMRRYNLCSIWNSNRYEDEEDMIYEITRNEASAEEYETLFMYQGQLAMMEVEIKKRVDYERNGDPMFAVWVDTYMLTEYLEHWINANINTQQRWYIVWCLMKYTFFIVKDDVNKQGFSERMNLMFPNAEKPCVEESYRKYEKKMNHDKHFSFWVTTDPDYHIAKSLYDKLSDKEKYKRESDLIFK